MGKADDTAEETGKSTLWDRRGTGSGIQGKILRDNVGKVRRAAGTGDNLRRLLQRGKTEVEERPPRLANESVVAKKEEYCSLRGRKLRLPHGGHTRMGQRDSGRAHRQHGGRAQNRP